MTGNVKFKTKFCRVGLKPYNYELKKQKLDAQVEQAKGCKNTLNHKKQDDPFEWWTNFGRRFQI